MCYCNQETISDGFLNNVVKLKSLDMSGCYQKTISSTFNDNLIHKNKIKMPFKNKL